MEASASPGSGTDTVHAACIVLAGAGVLIRGDSGMGKSTLALLLLDRADLIGMPAALVGDDRVRIARADDGLVARPHPALGPRIEVRGLGLCRALAPHDAARLALVVDLVAATPRLPETMLDRIALLGIPLPRLVLGESLLRTGLAPRLVLDALSRCGGVAPGTHRAILDISPGRPP